MAIGVYFAPESFPVAAYEQSVRELDAAGLGSPPARLYHCAMASPGGVHVFDVWESREQFEEFGATLMPILSDAGVDVGEPMISEVHNIIE